ncbi:hypothetical protein [Roseinatronobacter sp.]
MAVTVNLGRVQPIYRGPYSPSFPYRPLDFVTLDGVTFYCIKPVTGTPPPDTEFWVSILQLPLGIAAGGTGAITAEDARTSLGASEVGDALFVAEDEAAARAVIGAAAVNQIVPSGGIIMWSGLIATIPEGWFLCDGDNGTPDLRDRFVVGAGGDYGVDDTGGEAEVTLTPEQMPLHGHTGSTNNTGAHVHPTTGFRTLAGGTWFGGTGGNMGQASGTGSAGAHAHSLDIDNAGGDEAHNNLPPYYALAYIMKG